VRIDTVRDFELASGDTQALSATAVCDPDKLRSGLSIAGNGAR
jgi:hypothetical protein